ncbi:MAG: hypothetical protein MUF09_09615 [Candidatus Nanopelagicales bacterium]|nr:hypothetical protein [Candidatus Nanopelagicales bacterium]
MERRTFLALGAAAVGLTGCTSDPADPDRTSAPTAPDVQRDLDAALREGVAASEVALIAAHRAAIAAHPELAAALAPLVAHHEAHLARVAPGSPSGAGTPVASTSPDRSGSPESSPSSVPSVAETLAALAAAESQAQAQRSTACDGAVDPGLARDLCLVAASEAQHAALLEGLADEDASS